MQMQKTNVRADLRNLQIQRKLNLKREIAVSNFYEVKKYYESDHTADIISLVDDKDGYDEAVKINRCPVLETALIKIHMNESPHKQTPYYKPLEAGDKVFVVFNDVNLDGFTGGKYKKDNERRHSINDAVIVGRYKSKHLEW